MQLSSVDIVFLSIVVIFAVLIALAGWVYARSPVTSAHENMAKAGKYVAEAFVSITMFYMLFYLTLKGYISKDVLITLVSIFATAGFISIRNR